MYRCDRSGDCPDLSDEINCIEVPPCAEGQIFCNNTQCGIACDGIFQCDDGSDETNCSSTSPWQSNELTTTTSLGKLTHSYRLMHQVVMNKLHLLILTIPIVFVYFEVASSCTTNEFQCGDGSCVPLEQRCDGSDIDCPDMFDEMNCVEDLFCPEGHILCNNTMCVMGFVCDGIDQCSDGSDEWNCTLTFPWQPNELTAGTLGKQTYM